MFKRVCSCGLISLLSLCFIWFSTVSGLTFPPCKPANPDYKDGGIESGEWFVWAQFYSYCLQVIQSYICAVCVYVRIVSNRHFPPFQLLVTRTWISRTLNINLDILLGHMIVRITFW